MLRIVFLSVNLFFWMYSWQERASPKQLAVLHSQKVNDKKNNPHNLAHPPWLKDRAHHNQNSAPSCGQNKLFPYKTIHASVAHSYCYPWPVTLVKLRWGRYPVKREASINRKSKQAIQTSEMDVLIFHRLDLWVQACPAWNNSVLQHIQFLHRGDVTWVRIAQNQFFPSLNKQAASFLFFFFFPPRQISKRLSIIDP